MLLDVMWLSMAAWLTMYPLMHSASADRLPAGLSLAGYVVLLLVWWGLFASWRFVARRDAANLVSRLDVRLSTSSSSATLPIEATSGAHGPGVAEN